MRVIYGSQNFGYDTIKSDRDFAQIAFPTISDIMKNRKLDSTIHIGDGSQIKLIDIRSFPLLLAKCNFNDFQMLYAQKMTDELEFAWFIENREKIVRHNLKKLYESNVGFIHASIYRYKETYNYKELLRAKAFTDMLIRITTEEPFVMRNEELKIYRRFTIPIDEAALLNELASIKDYFQKPVDEEINQLIFEKSQAILITHLKEELNCLK